MFRPKARHLSNSMVNFYQLLTIVPVLGALTLTSMGQPGSLDPSFNPGTGVSRNGTARVTAIDIREDGKIWIGGDFGTVNGISRNRIALLNTDGSVEPSFNPGAGPNSETLAVAAAPGGKVVLGGDFTVVAG